MLERFEKGKEKMNFVQLRGPVCAWPAGVILSFCLNVYRLQAE